MKKLVIAIVAVAMASAVNAAAVSWATGNMFDHTNTQMKNVTTYTATISFFSDAAGVTDITSTFDGTGATLSSSTANKNGAYSGATVGSGIASGTYYAQVVISDGVWTISSAIAEFAYDSAKQSATTINFSNGSGFTETTSKWNYGATADNGWVQNVPEPTSGLLLLLGMAGLALRRRRA